METISWHEALELERASQQLELSKARGELETFVRENFFYLNGVPCIKGDRLNFREELDRQLRVLEIRVQDAWQADQPGQRKWSEMIDSQKIK